MSLTSLSSRNGAKNLGKVRNMNSCRLVECSLSLKKVSHQCTRELREPLWNFKTRSNTPNLTPRSRNLRLIKMTRGTLRTSSSSIPSTLTSDLTRMETKWREILMMSSTITLIRGLRIAYPKTRALNSLTALPVSIPKRKQIKGKAVRRKTFLDRDLPCHQRDHPRKVTWGHQGESSPL